MKRETGSLLTNDKEDEIIVLNSSNVTPLNVIPLDEEPTEANLKLENKLDHEQIKFYYLHEMSKEELEKLKNEFGKLPDELEKLVTEHPYLFWYYRIKNYFALGSNLLYLVFLINTSYEGIQSFVDVIKPNTVVPKPIGYGMGLPISIVDTLFHSLLYSALNEASKSTIRYTLSEPLSKQIQRKMTDAIEKPRTALFEASKFAINQTVLLSVNLNATMTELIDIYTNMENLPLAMKIPIIGSVLYFGNYYLKKYFNPDYYEGLNFWFNNKKHPWLIGEIWRGNFAVPLQIFLQGMISTVGIRTYPFFYYITDATNKAFNGLWFPTWLVILTSVWHSLCALYPYTYNYYMATQEKIEALLKENIDWTKVLEHADNMLKELNLDKATPEQLEKYIILAKNNYLNVQKNLLTAKVLEKHGNGVLAKKEIIVPLIARGGLGGYFGYQIVSSALMLIINEPISMSICGTIFGVALFAGALYKAEQKRELDELLYKEIEQINKDKNNDVVIDIIDPTSTSHSTHSSFISRVIADTANITTGIGNAISTIGTEARIFGTSPVTTIFVALTSIENSINGILFNKDKVRTTMHNACESVARVTSTSGTFFNQCWSKVKSIKNPTESLLPIYRN